MSAPTITSRTEQDLVIAFDGVSKSFGDNQIVHDLNLEVKRGEFLTLLGPSGCGKTTTLRMIGGFEFPTEGRIDLDNADVSNLLPFERDTAMVFQEYALFPHLTVRENVAFGLKMRKVRKATRNHKADDYLELIGMSAFADRYPAQLSGGQRQRVAIARSLIVEPSVLLLDEPLGALDAKLRRTMQFELRRIQKEVGITFVYVTHDQEEALTMSDRVAIMHHGRIIQLDSPTALYEHPSDQFVATFLGECNLPEGRVASHRDGTTVVELDSLGAVEATLGGGQPLKPGDPCMVAIRPEWLHVVPAGTPNAIEATVQESAFTGPNTRAIIEMPNQERFILRVAGRHNFEIGERIHIGWDATKLRVLRAE